MFRLGKKYTIVSSTLIYHLKCAFPADEFCVGEYRFAQSTIQKVYK